MIIQIRGTSGSGKSTLVKSILDLDQNRRAHYLGGGKELEKLVPGHLIFSRGRPLGYVMNVDEFVKPVYVMGHYEAACGGADTLILFGNVWIYKFAENLHTAGYDVIVEGLILGHDRKLSSDFLSRGLPYRTMELTLPLEECVKSVKERRARRGVTGPINEKRMATKARGISSIHRKLENEFGVTVFRGNREQVRSHILNLLSK